MSALVPARDAIQEVCGVPAADILRRCAELRASRLLGAAPGRPAWPGFDSGGPDSRGSWSLLEFGDGSREAFVEAAYLALLGRWPYEREVAARLAQLRAGRTRLGIVLRLALSAEGRRAQQPRISGSGLRMLLRSARRLHALALPVVRAIRR